MSNLDALLEILENVTDFTIQVCVLVVTVALVIGATITSLDYIFGTDIKAAIVKLFRKTRGNSPIGLKEAKDQEEFWLNELQEDKEKV